MALACGVESDIRGERAVVLRRGTRRGIVQGLIGANGAGKSTLLDIIGGEQSADAGSIHLGGKELAGPPYRRARLGLGRTFQKPAVSLEMTVYENIAAGLSVRSLNSRRSAYFSPLRSMLTGAIPSRATVAGVCDRLGIRGMDREAKSLSFGELRLLEVARALVQEPDVLLLDEPLPGVEDENVERFVATLRQLAADGQTIILVDHNLSIVQDVVDEVILLAGGQIVFQGDVADCVKSDAFRREYVGIDTSQDVTG